MKFALESGEPIADGLVRVMRVQIRRLRNLAEDSAGDPREFVRQARVVSKRIRAALLLARPFMSEKSNREIRFWWRDQARALSETRDLAARVDALGSIGGDLADAAGDRLANGLRSKFERELARGEKAAAGGPVEAFREALAGAPAPDPHAMKEIGFEELLDSYLKGYKKARRDMRTATESGDVEDYHEWRKSAKVHALQTRLLRRLSPAIEDRADQTRYLAQTLGELQDVSISRIGLDAMPAPPGGRAGREKLTAALEEKQLEVIRAARELGHKVFNFRAKHLREEILAARAQSGRGPLRVLEDAEG